MALRVSMQLFYFHHRWLAFYRRGDLWKLVTLIFLLAMFVFRLGRQVLSQVETWIIDLSDLYGWQGPEAFQLILVLFILGVTAIKVAIAPAPLYYEPYRLWPVNKTSLAFQYLLLSHLKPANLFWLFSEVTILVKSIELGMTVWPFMLVCWLIQHSWNIILHPLRILKWGASIFFLVLAIVIYQSWLGFDWVQPLIGSTTSLLIVAAVSMTGAIWIVNRRPESFLKKPKLSSQAFQGGLGEINDPLIDLEVKLIWRNKGTRTNLIAGFLTIPFLIYYFGNVDMPGAMFFVAVISTGLVLLQHGIYTISWEGNYFDWMVTRFSALEFMHAKHRFYLWANFIGFIFSGLVLFINVEHWLPIMAAFLYNTSWNCYTVLFGTLDNKRKLPLGESIVMKASSMSSNVLILSFMTIILPMVLLGICSVVFTGTWVYYGIMGFSLVGLLLRDPILGALARRMDRKKYELSTSFHD